MTPFDHALARLTREPSRRFLRYWRGLKGARALPDRRDIDPAAIAPLLPKLWLWEYRPERGDFVNRLAGGEIESVFQRNPRGLTLAEWVPPAVADVARPRYRRVIDGPAICIAAGTSFIAGDKQAWCERAMAPMTNGGAAATVVFGITVWEGAAFTTGPVEREETEAAFFPV